MLIYICMCARVCASVCKCVCVRTLSDSDLLQPWAKSASSAELQEGREKPSLQNACSLDTHAGSRESIK